MKRACGSCTLCCTLQGVHEGLDTPKPPGVPCPHLGAPEGCSIYGSRPSECATYTCLWLEGFGMISDRPDKLGVVFEAQPGPQPFAAVRVTERGVERGPRVRELMCWLLDCGVPVGIVHLDDVPEDWMGKGTITVYTEPSELP